MKTIMVSPTERVLVQDSGELGIVIVRQERRDRGPKSRASWKRGEEECLVPREAWPAVIAEVTRILGGKP